MDLKAEYESLSLVLSDTESSIKVWREMLCEKERDSRAALSRRESLLQEVAPRLAREKAMHEIHISLHHGQQADLSEGMLQVEDAMRIRMALALCYGMRLSCGAQTRTLRARMPKVYTK